MPFITLAQVDPVARQKAEQELRTRLRQALLGPALTTEQKTSLKKELDALGKPKVY